MPSFPELSTPRLLLRKITLADMPALLKHVNHQTIFDNILNFPSPYQEGDALARIALVEQGLKNKARCIFAITLRSSQELIGEIGLHLDKPNHQAEMGFWLGADFWGQGLMSEAVAAALKFGFETIGLNKIYATHFLNNPASGKVLANNGMVKEAESLHCNSMFLKIYVECHSHPAMVAMHNTLCVRLEK